MNTEIEYYRAGICPAFWRNAGTGQIIRVGEWTPAQLRYIASEMDKLEEIANEAIAKAGKNNPALN